MPDLFEAPALEESEGGIRFSRTISLQTVLIVLGGQLLGALLWGMKIDSRVSSIEATRIEYRAMQRDRDDHQDHENASAFEQMRAQLEKMDGKLDRLIEKNTTVVVPSR